MKYTKQSAGIDGLIILSFVSLFALGASAGFNDSTFGKVCISLLVYLIGTVFLLSHFYSRHSGILCTSSVLCTEVMVPRHAAGAIIWSIFTYCAATVALILIAFSSGSHDTSENAEQISAANDYPLGVFARHRFDLDYSHGTV